MEFKQLILQGTSWMLLLLKSRTLAEDPQSHTSSGMTLQNSKKQEYFGNCLTSKIKNDLFINFIQVRPLILQSISKSIGNNSHKNLKTEQKIN